uniref:Uncharacterized protein n=1 Tax=Octopus bimaculoides TaxID=37653 RepID=A0A0L8IE46_OCTBM
MASFMGSNLQDIMAIVFNSATTLSSGAASEEMLKGSSFITQRTKCCFILA